MTILKSDQERFLATLSDADNWDCSHPSDREWAKNIFEDFERWLEREAERIDYQI